jgi:hypothetical protein
MKDLLLRVILKAAYDHHSDLHSQDESEAEAWATQIGMMDDELPEDAVAMKFLEYAKGVISGTAPSLT